MDLSNLMIAVWAVYHIRAGAIFINNLSTSI